MKIIHLIENLDDRYGGPAKSIPELCYNLQKLDIASEVVSIKKYDIESNESIKKYQIKWNSFQYSFLKPLSYSCNIKKYIENIISNNDVIINIHNQWNYIPILGFILKIKYNIPMIATLRGSIKPDKIQKKIAWVLFQKKLYQIVDLVHVTKKDDIKILRDMGITTPIAYIPNGVNLNEFQNLNQKNKSKKELELNIRKQYILFISRVHTRKGLKYLINAWVKIAKEIQSWDLLIAGPIHDEKYYKTIKSILAKNDLEDRVNFKGMLKGKDRIHAYNASSLFVLPSYTENFGMAIAEAMAAKLPVITTKGTPWSEIEEYNAGWWVELSQENINQALYEALICIESELTQKGLNGYELIKTYEWKYQAKKMKNMYEWVLDEGNKPEFVYDVRK